MAPVYGLVTFSQYWFQGRPAIHQRKVSISALGRRRRSVAHSMRQQPAFTGPSPWMGHWPLLVDHVNLPINLKAVARIDALLHSLTTIEYVRN